MNCSVKRKKKLNTKAKPKPPERKGSLKRE
jgi:hypothetical protein